jgi:cyanophycinase
MTRGYIIPIGGAEEKISKRSILKKFLQISGGKEARIVIIPTASQLAETGPRYVDIFAELGAGECVSLPFEERSDCERKDWLEILENATGVFMTGGNQLRLSTTIGGTSVAEMLRDRNNSHGLHVAGTSAGASIMSEHMIAYGDEGIVPRCDMVSLSPGFGLTKE